MMARVAGIDQGSNKPVHPRVLKSDRNTVLTADTDGVAGDTDFRIGQIDVEQTANRSYLIRRSPHRRFSALNA
jgi:hypothetical protein